MLATACAGQAELDVVAQQLLAGRVRVADDLAQVEPRALAHGVAVGEPAQPGPARPSTPRRALGGHDLEGDGATVVAGADRQHRDAVVDGRDRHARPSPPRPRRRPRPRAACTRRRDQERAVAAGAEARRRPARRPGRPSSPAALGRSRRAGRGACDSAGTASTQHHRMTTATSRRAARRVTTPTQCSGQPSWSTSAGRRRDLAGHGAAADQRQQGRREGERHQDGHRDGRRRRAGPSGSASGCRRPARAARAMTTVAPATTTAVPAVPVASAMLAGPRRGSARRRRRTTRRAGGGAG